MSYDQLIDKLFQVNVFGGTKLGLSNCHRLQEILNYPSQAFKSVHVAGTNGKGSVSLMIAKGLEAAGYKVGLYTSPHIASFRERIRINGKMIPKESIELLLPHLFSITEKNKIPATFFELTTFLAFLYFLQEKVDIAVLETGLGGRFDATNVVTPLLSVITSISLDHTEILGSTIEAITEEKAGIIKSQVPVVIGPSVPIQIIRRIADELSSPFLKAVSGKHDSFIEENQSIARIALKELNVPDSAIEEGLKARQPCRMEVYQDKVILDVAHNPDGLKRLFQAIHRQYGDRPIRIVFGLSESKDIHACLEVIRQQATVYHLIKAPNGRGLSVSRLYEEMLKLNIESEMIHQHHDIPSAVQQALEQATKKGEVLVICGTFFIMSQARQALGIKEETDLI